MQTYISQLKSYKTNIAYYLRKIEIKKYVLLKLSILQDKAYERKQKQKQKRQNLVIKL